MAKRKKRLEKSINSLEKQIEIHKKKLEDAKAEDRTELTGYYEKEINALENTKKLKKNLLKKQDK